MTDPGNITLPPLDANDLCSRVERLDPNLFARVVAEARAQQLVERTVFLESVIREHEEQDSSDDQVDDEG